MEYADILTGLRRILRSINLESKKVHKEFGVSIPQLLTLEYLNSCEGYRTRASHLKDHLNLNASTVSGIIARLEKKGLITRVPNSADRRVQDVVLSASGSDLIRKAPRLIQQKITDRLSKLPENEVAQLTRSVEILASIFDADKLDASPVITISEFDE